ncbi:GGDEF domain-containing protein, partial [Photobacterium sanctipauli]
ANKCMLHSEYTKQPFSVMLFDIDKFKRINDTWGHSAGDQVLKEFTQFIQSQSKGDELFGRFGGEEFILFLPKTHFTQAEQLADKLLASIRQLQLDIGVDDTKIRITTSIGISSFTDGDTLSSLLERADNALYECKDAGRDCRRYHPAGYKYSSRAECQLVG